MSNARNQTAVLRPLRRLSREERRVLNQTAMRWSVLRKSVLWCSVAAMIACVVVPVWLQSLLSLGLLLLFGWPIALACIRWAIEKDRKMSERFDDLADQLSDVAIDHGGNVVSECITDGVK